MAVNRFSPIQGLPEWQPQIPLELLTKALVYKQELFDKNKSLIQSNIATSTSLADDILNENASNYAKDKINNYKKYLNSNLAYADLTDDAVMGQADTKLGDLANDDIFVNNLYISKKAKETMQKYRESKEKGDGSYNPSNEWFSGNSINAYVKADLNTSKDAKIVGYTKNVDYLKQFQDALKDIKDFSDVEVQWNDNGYYFVKNKTEILDQDKVMSRIRPYLTPEVEGQIYRDALYKNQDDASFFKTKAEEYKSSKDIVTSNISKLEKEIVMNPGNGRVVAEKKQLLAQYKNQLQSLDQDLTKAQNFSTLSEDEKNNYKVQSYRSSVLNGVVASHTFTKQDQDIEWNQLALKQYEAQKAEERLKMEYNLGQPELYNTSIESTQDFSKYSFDEFKNDRTQSWNALQQKNTELAKRLDQLYVQNGGEAGTFYNSKDATVNQNNLNQFLKTHQFGKLTGQAANATMNLPEIKHLLDGVNQAEKAHYANVTMWQTALQQAGTELGMHPVDPWEKYTNKQTGKLVSMNSIIASQLGAKDLNSLTNVNTAFNSGPEAKKRIVAHTKELYGDKAAAQISKFLDSNLSTHTTITAEEPGMLQKLAAWGTSLIGGTAVAQANATTPTLVRHTYNYNSDLLIDRATAIMAASKQEKGPIGVGGIGMRYDPKTGKYSINQKFGAQLSQAASQSSSRELREIAGNISDANSKVLAVYQDTDGVFKARVAVPVKSGKDEGDFKSNSKVVTIPVNDPSMIATVKEFQLKQSDYTTRVENYLTPDATRLNARVSSKTLAGALDSKNGYIKFSVDEQNVGGMNVTRFIPFDNRTGILNQELGNAFSTGSLGINGNALPPEELLNFFDWAEANGHTNLGSYKLDQAQTAFISYLQRPIAGPQGRVTARTTKEKTAQGTRTVQEKYNY